MQPLPPPTPFEMNTLGAHQFLAQMKLRNNLLNEPVTNCLRKCVDLSDLLENKRSVGQTKMARIKEDEVEKKCLEFCSLKWDELHRRISMHLQRKEIMNIQMEMMADMKKQAEAQNGMYS
eukprot:PhF_6_TR18041/c0_g1_i1/m.26898